VERKALQIHNLYIVVIKGGIRIFPFRSNLKMTDDFGFIFGGMMYEMTKVCRVEESAESTSPLCHQGAKPLKV
jgi:hypothetical protein